MKNILIDGAGGKKLYCRVWDNVENPKGVVQIVHGMGEHAGRYSHFAEFLNDNGYIVFGDDHRAHGLTEDDRSRGHIDGDIFGDTVRDEILIYDYLKQTYNLPVILFGHSYGSFLAQSFLEQGTDIDGVAMTGTGVIKPFVTKLGMGLCKFLMLFNKKMHLKILESLAALRDRLKYRGKDDVGGKLWLTRDSKYREISINDKMSGVSMSVSFYYYMLKGVRNAETKTAIAKMRADTPVGIFCGSCDPIGGDGKSAEKLRSMYIAGGIKYIVFKLYDGARHEVLNEINRDEVMRDMLAFFDYCLARRKIRREYEAG